MDPLVDLAHVATNRFLPRRGRVERLGLEVIATPVRPIRVASTEMRPAGTVDGLDVREHDGRMWIPLPVDGFEGLSAYVRDKGRRVMHGGDGYVVGLHSLVGRSPFLACVNHGVGTVEVMPPDGAGLAIVSDGREQARADLVEHVAANLRDVEGTPHVRMRGPLLATIPLVGGARTIPSLGAWSSLNPLASTVPWRADRKSAFLVDRADGEAPGWWAPVDGLDDCPMPERRGLDDVGHFVQSAPGQLIALARMAVRAAGDGRLRDAPLAVVRDMAPLFRRGILGCIPETEFEEAAVAIAAAADSVVATWYDLGSGCLAEPNGIAAYAREYVLPALVAAPSAEDAEALEGLTGAFGDRDAGPAARGMGR